MKNIAIYGGAFDPPHIGHIQLIQHLTTLKGIDQVWLMPCGDRTDKKLLLPKQKRFQLMRQLFQNNTSVKVSQDEIKLSQQLGGQICTYDLLSLLKKQYIEAQFHFVIGADIIQTIYQWNHSDKLIKENSFILYQRKGYNLNTSKFISNRVVEVELPEISSSYIKKILQDPTAQRSQKSTLIKPWLAPQVIEFLMTEGVL